MLGQQQLQNGYHFTKNMHSAYGDTLPLVFVESHYNDGRLALWIRVRPFDCDGGFVSFCGLAIVSFLRSVVLAKLNISVDTKFVTMPLQVTEDFKRVFLDAKKGRAFFEKVAAEDLEFDVVSTNKDLEAAFPFSAKLGKKNSKFVVSMPEDADHLEVEIVGDFSVSVRAGVGPRLQELGDSLDLRIRAVTWKGGYYRGFSAWVKDADFEQTTGNWRETFPKVSSWSLK